MPQETFDARTAITAAPAVVGMAALWMSLYKRLLYPVMFSFQRTGFDGGMIAQGVYALVFVTALFALYAFRGKAARALVVHKWIAVVFGVGGVIGLFLLTPSSLSGTDTAEAFNVGSVLVALYMPVHLAFWTFYMRLSNTSHVDRTLIGSFALFLAINLALIPLGGQSSTISIACPIVSTIMIAICKPIARPSSETALEKPAASVSDATPSSAPARSPSSTPDVPSSPAPTSSPMPSSALSTATVHEPESAPPLVAALEPSSSATTKPSPSTVPQAPPQNEAPKTRNLRLTIRQFGKDFGLSDREAELSAYAYHNYSARKIASELFIAESTVYTHLKRIYKKTGVHSKAELIDLIDGWKEANGFGER